MVKTPDFQVFVEYLRSTWRNLEMNVRFCAIHVSSIMCKCSFVVIILIKENFCPFKREILAGVFTWSRGKNAHPLGH